MATSGHEGEATSGHAAPSLDQRGGRTRAGASPKPAEREGTSGRSAQAEASPRPADASATPSRDTATTARAHERTRLVLSATTGDGVYDGLTLALTLTLTLALALTLALVLSLTIT